MKTEIKGISLFSSAGIGEYFLSRIGIRIVAANELIPKRADLYRKIYPEHKMITGDIKNKGVFDEILNIAIENNVDFLLASPHAKGLVLREKIEI